MATRKTVTDSLVNRGLMAYFLITAICVFLTSLKCSPFFSFGGPWVTLPLGQELVVTLSSGKGRGKGKIWFIIFQSQKQLFGNMIADNYTKMPRISSENHYYIKTLSYNLQAAMAMGVCCGAEWTQIQNQTNVHANWFNFSYRALWIMQLHTSIHYYFKTVLQIILICRIPFESNSFINRYTSLISFVTSITVTKAPI